MTSCKFWSALFVVAVVMPAVAQEEGRYERRLPGGVKPGVFAENPEGLADEQSRIAQEIPKTDVFAQLGTFFAEAFSFVRFTREPGGAASTIQIEPNEVQLGETREIRVTFQVENKTGKMLRLTFPTEQRLEILVRNEAGEIIERWSEDRSFAQAIGFVSINPDEKLAYVEDLSTREMRPAESYFVEASLVDHPDYAAIGMIKTLPKSAEAEPAEEGDQATADEAAATAE